MRRPPTPGVYVELAAYMSRARARLKDALAAWRRRTAAAARRKTGAAEVGATAAAE